MYNGTNFNEVLKFLIYSTFINETWIINIYDFPSSKNSSINTE